MLSERLLELLEKNELRGATREIVLDEFKQKNLLGLLELMLDKTTHFYRQHFLIDREKNMKWVFDWVERNPKLLLKWIVNDTPRSLPPLRLSDELIELGIDYNAPSNYYSIGHKWKNVDALRKAVINNVPEDFYRKCKDMDLNDKHFSTIKNFSESEKSDKSGYDIWGDHKNLEDMFFELINLYGEKIINWAKSDSHLLDVLPLKYYGTEDYVELIKPHLSKKYWKKLINRSFILFAQDYIKECVTGEKKNSLGEVLKNNSVGAKQLVKSLDEKIIKNYDKEIKIDNPIRVLKDYYVLRFVDTTDKYEFLVNNEAFGSDSFNKMLEQLIAGEYESKEHYFFEKDFSINSGIVKVKLDSDDKLGQIKLLRELYSCFNVVRGSEKQFSRSYLLTDRINFAGIYDVKGNPLGRFTVVLNPEEKKVGITSTLITKQKSFHFMPQVTEWVQDLANNLDYELAGSITLPVYAFYDDVTPRRGYKGDIETNSIVIDTLAAPMEEKVEYQA